MTRKLVSSVLLEMSILNRFLYPVMNTSRAGTGIPSFLLVKNAGGPGRAESI
jgi:hypothetical protein